MALKRALEAILVDALLYAIFASAWLLAPVYGWLYTMRNGREMPARQREPFDL